MCEALHVVVLYICLLGVIIELVRWKREHVCLSATGHDPFPN
jgi:hypothetical protein